MSDGTSDARASPLTRPTVAAVAAFALASCDRLDNFAVPFSGKGTIPKATLLDELLGTVAIGGLDEISFSQSFENQGVSEGDVDSVWRRG